MTCRELIIIDGKCYDIQNLGWNPKQLNPQLKEMCKGKDLRAKSFQNLYKGLTRKLPYL